VKKQRQQKEVKKPSAKSLFLSSIDTEKKKIIVLYSISIFVLALSLLSFLLFGPFRNTVFSSLGDKILGKEEVVLDETFTEDAEDDSEEIMKAEEEPEEEEEEEEEEVEEVELTEPSASTSPPPSTIAQPSPEPTPAREQTPIEETEPIEEPIPVPEETPKCADSLVQEYEEALCYNAYYMGYYVGQGETYWMLAQDCPDEFYTDYQVCYDHYMAESQRVGAISDTYYSNAMEYKPLLVGCEYPESSIESVYWSCYEEGMVGN
jgi:hypothetical protein